MDLGEVSVILLIIAAVLFVFGFIASSSQYLFVLVSWALSALFISGAVVLWVISTLQRFR